MSTVSTVISCSSERRCRNSSKSLGVLLICSNRGILMNGTYSKTNFLNRFMINRSGNYSCSIGLQRSSLNSRIFSVKEQMLGRNSSKKCSIKNGCYTSINIKRARPARSKTLSNILRTFNHGMKDNLSCLLGR